MANVISGISSLLGTPTQARVTLVNSDTNAIVSSQLSNAATGEWAFPNLPAGRYEVITLIAGYKARVDGPWVLDGTDSHFANVVSLLHFDGADASTVFTDQAGRVWTPAGNAQLDTSWSAFGTASLQLDGSGDYISTPASMNAGASDFTLEAVIRPAGYGTHFTIFDCRSSGLANGLVLYVNRASNRVEVEIRNGGAFVGGPSSTTSIAIGTSVHVALCRAGSSYLLFVNGFLEGDKPLVVYDHSNGSARIGSTSNNDANWWANGNIDEFRFTKGVARYVNNFVPPTAAFPNS